MRKLITALLLFAAVTLYAHPGTSVAGLKVQNQSWPLSVEDRHPSFSWRMESDVRGQKQTAYRIVVTRCSDGAEVWDSGRVDSSASTDIRYSGVALQPQMPYDWTLYVWEADGDCKTGSSHFETGLMNPRLYAWNGAQWIGDPTPMLDAASLFLFSISSDFAIYKGTQAGFIFGADDFRLGNAFYNEYLLESKENYFKLVLDMAGLGTPAGAEIRIYRVGYAPGDSADKPLYVINKANYPKTNLNEIIKGPAAGVFHKLKLIVETGTISIEVDGSRLLADAQAKDQAQSGRFQVNPLGAFAHDVNTFPHLGSIGFLAPPQSDVVYSEFTISGEGQSETPLFSAGQRSVFEALSCVRMPKFRNQGAYSSDIVVINKEESEVIEYLDPSSGGCKMLRRDFSVPSGKVISRARLYASAMGVYNCSLNGEKAGQDWFAPGDSQYRETISYQVYDVTSSLKAGENTIAVELFPGWYTGYQTYTASNFNVFGDSEAFLCKLCITYDDGTQDVIVTDPEHWKVSDAGPVRFGGFFPGERYDANLEASVRGWDRPRFDDRGWKTPSVIPFREWMHPDIVARFDELVQVRETISSVELKPVLSEDGHTYIYDMGVDLVGVPSVTIPQGWLKSGDVVVMRYAEQLYPGLPGDAEEYVQRFGAEGNGLAGHMLFATNRAAMDTDFYIAAGSSEVTYTPRSTYRGYRYVQITLPSHAGPLPTENVKALVLSSCPLPTGTYQAVTADGTTGELVNRLFANIQRSQLGNFFTLPTDCPQRNERMGWTGDAQAYSRTATYNADVLNFFRQWMRALRDDQGVGNATEVPGGIGTTSPAHGKSATDFFDAGTTWSAAVCMVPWQMYIQYGDKRMIEENLDAMMDWLNGMAFYRMNDQYPHLSSRTWGLSDWLAPDDTTPAELINNAIYINMMEVTAIMAEAVGRDDYASMLRKRHDMAKEEWNKAYVDPQTGRTRNVTGEIVHTQTSYATPLNFNVFDESNRTRAEAHLADLVADPNHSGPTPDDHASKGDFKPYTVTTGFSGTPNLLPALTRGGYIDEACRLLCSTEYPSWLHEVTMGATTVWERWNSYKLAFSGRQDASTMNSFNHFALGAVGQWLYEYQLGITTDYLAGAAGYGHFVLQPCPGGSFTSLSGSYESRFGTISVGWTAAEGELTSYTVSIPANTSATLYLPVGITVGNFGSCESVTFQGIGSRNNRTVAIYELPSGKYSFEVSETNIHIT